ncbi:MAG: hypothetical protein OXR66_00895 [Candidatus Woesearchaeota archaeon]|nr:hypothetical protein [Candidatus Woesearchaeota archaeon]
MDNGRVAKADILAAYGAHCAKELGMRKHTANNLSYAADTATQRGRDPDGSKYQHALNQSALAAQAAERVYPAAQSLQIARHRAVCDQNGWVRDGSLVRTTRGVYFILSGVESQKLDVNGQAVHVMNRRTRASRALLRGGKVGSDTPYGRIEHIS